MEPQEKVKAPQSWLDQRNEEAGRRQLIGEWGDYLKSQQREALDEQGPHAGFKTRIPLGALKSFTDSEREELMNAEHAEYNRLRPLAEAKRTQRSAYVKAGGDEEEFNEIWNAGGREMAICELASGGDLGPSRDQFSSPY